MEAWFTRMRECGGDVRELMHDGCPTACVDDAAFGYVAKAATMSGAPPLERWSM